MAGFICDNCGTTYVNRPLITDPLGKDCAMCGAGAEAIIPN